MRKHLIIFFTALATLSSCSKLSPVANSGNADKGSEISFQVAKALATTKADSYSGAVFAEDAFGAYAWQTGNASDDYYMEAVKIIKKVAAWIPDGPAYYWPKDGTLDFECFAPYNDGKCWFVISDNGEGKANRLTARHTIDVKENSFDLLYSDKAVNCNSSDNNEIEDDQNNAYTGVPVIFRHALSMCKVQIKSSSLISDDKKSVAVVTFKNASLNNVCLEGELVLDLQDSGETSGTRKWANTNNVWEIVGDKKGVYEDVLPDNVKIGTAAKDIIGSIITIPQILTDQSVQLEIEIDIYDAHDFEKDSAGNVIFDEDGVAPKMKDSENPPKAYIHETLDKSYKLKDIPGVKDRWKIGESTSYVITISPFKSIITFDPCIAPWVSVTSEWTGN